MVTNPRNIYDDRNPELTQFMLVQNMVGTINAMNTVQTVAEDYYPILHTPLSVHNGITITGKFKTSVTGSALSYVTVLRRSDTTGGADGLGFAWMPGDGSKYNVYLVDNNPLNNDLMFNENFLLQNAGENTFLAAAKGVISSNIQYSFRLDIGLNYSTDLWIWPTSEGTLNPNGAHTIKLSHSSFNPRSAGNHLGISVVGTNGAEWYYSDLLIQSASFLHTAALYKMKVSTSMFPDGSTISLKYYGYGYDGTNYGLKAFVYKPLTLTWDEFGSNTSTNVTPTNLCLIQSNPLTISNAYRDAGEFVYIMVTTPLTGIDASQVITYYVSVGNTSSSGIHIGGKADVYVEDPDNIVTAEQLVSNIGGHVNLSAANGFASPILNVAKVVVEITGEDLTEFADWKLYSDNPGLAYSTREIPYLSIDTAFNMLQLRVTYRFNQKGVAMQALLDSDEYRFIGTDSLAKLMPPVIVSFNDVNALNYKGTLTLENAQALIKNYVLNNKVLVLSEIISLLAKNGATYVDATTMNFDVTEYDHLRKVVSISKVKTSYEVPSGKSAYTDVYSMTGIVKL